MQIIRFFFILFMFPLFLAAQQKTKIILKDSSRGTTTKAADGGTVSYVKNPVFQHLSAILTCDSAVFYETRNVFEAYNNVHINQNDSINIFSDHLTYDGNTKIAHLTNNVRMIDNKSTLTTNILDYNTGTKIGTYVDGGKIVNKDVTITSKNGYYFSNSKDAYFRYNAVAVSPKVRITSDTLRYNTGTNWAYFYGPTNIKGKDDNLYTENGAYNTKTEYAYFGKKNLYTSNSKSLKGDSLYYDGIAGYGKAVKNIVFRDTSDKTVLYGQKGYYYKKTERAVVTNKAYVGMGSSDSIKVNDKLVPDTLWMGADTLETQMVLQKNLNLIESPILKKDNELGDAEDEKREAAEKEGPADPKTLNTTKNNVPPTVSKSPGKKSQKDTVAADSLSLSKVPIKKDEIKVATDSLKSALPDSIKSAIDTLAKQTVSAIRPDSISKKTSDSLVKKATNTIKATGLKDSVVTPMDTIKTRIIKAYHKVRVFKANMQAVADSLFYTNADSTLRWFGSPILWSQGSQQTGDTIYLRLKNKKLNTLQVLQNGFLVNVYADSAKFNQIKGKLITAFFKDGELSTMFVDGNAESVYYGKSGKDSTYTDMNQTVSSRIKIRFLNKEITNILTIKKPEAVRIPVAELKEDVLLTGFTWKPELRPLSKKEVINGKTKAQLAKKTAAPASKTPPAKTQATKTKNMIGAARSLINDQLNKNNLDTIPASLIDTNKIDTEKVKREIKKADSVIKKLSPVPLKKP